MEIEISYTVTSEFVWSGDFDDLPDELQATVAAALPDGKIDSHDEDDLAEVINSEITDVDLLSLGTTGAEMQCESYEVDNVSVTY